MFKLKTGERAFNQFDMIINRVSHSVVISGLHTVYREKQISLKLFQLKGYNLPGKSYL